jgi:AraC family transcriptional regulator of adaptative response/methylated-DNA-[protein]-cysteine methyltransferase
MVFAPNTDDAHVCDDHERIRFAFGECSLGTILVAASGKGVSAIIADDGRAPLLRELRRRFPTARLIDAGVALDSSLAEIIASIEMPARIIALPLDLRGTEFQCRVWQAVRGIPAGSTVSYGELAQRIDASHSARAVARACAANVLAVAVPCHRVIRADGALGGYRWGKARKEALLAREAA